MIRGCLCCFLLAVPECGALQRHHLTVGGKHGRGSGIVKDYEKLNHAQALGWTVLQLTPQQVENGELEKWLRKLA